MKWPILVCVFACTQFPGSVSTAPQSSTYAGQEARNIKSLSSEEIDAYLAGKGMGLAKAAELNGYAGPSHVLELASQLELTPQQRAETEALFTSMQKEASELGRSLVEQERKLDRLFATRSVDDASLATALHEIGITQARLRGAHLKAHLAQARILTPNQISRYAQLRGYGRSGVEMDHSHHQSQ